MAANSVRKLRVFIPEGPAQPDVDLEAVGRRAAALTADYISTAFTDGKVNSWLEKLARAGVGERLEVVVETLGDVVVKLQRFSHGGFTVKVTAKERETKRAVDVAARAALESPDFADGIKHAFAVHRMSSPGARHAIETAFRGEASKRAGRLAVSTDSERAAPSMHAYGELQITLSLNPTDFETVWNWPANAVLAAAAERAAGFSRTGAAAQHKARMDLLALVRRDVLAAQPPT